MIKIIIKQKGKLVTLTGIPQFRTPAEVNITNLKIDLVIKELRKQGITDYQIMYDDHNKKTIPVKSKKNNQFIKKYISSKPERIFNEDIQDEDMFISNLEISSKLLIKTNTYVKKFKFVKRSKKSKKK